MRKTIPPTTNILCGEKHETIPMQSSCNSVKSFVQPFVANGHTILIAGIFFCRLAEDCLAGEYSGLTENKTCEEIGAHYKHFCEKRFVRQRCCVACSNRTSSSMKPYHTTSSPSPTAAMSIVDSQCERKHGPSSFMCRVRMYVNICS